MIHAFDRAGGILCRAGIALALTWAGCSSSSDGNGSNSGAETPQGVFADAAAVEGLDYSTDTHSGTTDAEGTFSYEEGETVTFALGELPFGAAEGAEVLTAWDLAQNEDEDNTLSFINRIVMLQSLDDDQEASNGILIDQEHVSTIEGQTFDFATEATANFLGFNEITAIPAYYYLDEGNALSNFISGMTTRFEYPITGLDPDQNTSAACLLGSEFSAVDVSFGEAMDDVSAVAGTILVFDLGENLLFTAAGVMLVVGSSTEWGIWHPDTASEERSVLIVLTNGITNAGGDPLPATFFWTFHASTDC